MAATKLGVYIPTPTLAGFQAFNAEIAPRAVDQLLFLSDMNTAPVIGSNWGSWAATLGASIHSTWSPFETSMGAFAAGTYDTTGLYNNAGLVGAATTCATYGKPVVVRLAHEFNGSWVGTYGEAHETAAQYVAGWQHVVNLFRANGATNVQWCWSPNVFNLPFNHTIDPTVADSSGVNWYPGDNYVDLIALDAYHFLEDSLLYVPSDMILPSYTSVRALAPSKPFGMAEFGCAADARLQAFCGGKSNWYTLLFELFATQMQCLFVQQWQQSTSSAQPLDDLTISSSGTDPAAAAAFIAGVTTPTMTAGNVGLFHR